MFQENDRRNNVEKSRSCLLAKQQQTQDTRRYAELFWIQPMAISGLVLVRQNWWMPVVLMLIF